MQDDKWLFIAHGPFPLHVSVSPLLHSFPLCHTGQEADGPALSRVHRLLRPVIVVVLIFVLLLLVILCPFVII